MLCDRRRGRGNRGPNDVIRQRLLALRALHVDDGALRLTLSPSPANRPDAQIGVEPWRLNVPRELDCLRVLNGAEAGEGERDRGKYQVAGSRSGTARCHRR